LLLSFSFANIMRGDNEGRKWRKGILKLLKLCQEALCKSDSWSSCEWFWLKEKNKWNVKKLLRWMSTRSHVWASKFVVDKLLRRQRCI